MITVENLTKSYRDLRVLNGITHRQSAGETVVVIGPSGCGKSTFLRCLNQLEDADSGRICIDGIGFDCGARLPPKVRRSEQQRLRLAAGMVFQSFNLFPHLTALENVSRPPVVVKGMPQAEARELAQCLLARVGLEDKGSFLPSQLSGGQQQRVAIARALAMQPKVMLFDEPTSALDPSLRGEVLRAMRQLADEGMTMIIVTHEMQFAREIADRVLFLDRGLVAESGAPEQVLSNPAHPRTRQFLNDC